MKHKDLPECLRRKERDSLQVLKTQYIAMLRYSIQGILPDVLDQDECLNDILMRIWEKIDRYDSEKGAFEAWMVTIARNTALNRARTLQRTRNQTEVMTELLSDSAPSPEELVLRKERAKRIRSLADELPQTERLLFYRKYYYMQSTEQIAAELGLSIRAVEGRLYRLRKKLRKELEHEYE